MATMIAWNMTATKARAETEVVESGSGLGDPNWEIRSAEIGKEYLGVEDSTVRLDRSHGEHKDWTWGGVSKKARLILRLFAHAPANPANGVNGGEQFAGSATCAISVMVNEWAEISDIVNGEPQHWDDMSTAQWQAWTGTAPDNAAVCSTSALLEKSVNANTRVVSVSSRNPGVGDDDTTSQEGIYIKRVWNGDTLNIVFRALAKGIEENDWDLESQWQLKNSGGTGQ